MKSSIKHADSKGRVTIPDLANATLIVEKVNGAEYRIRKARVIPESDFEFHEEKFPIELSARDAALVLELLDNPPKPNKAMLAAAREYVKIYGNPLNHRKTRKKA